MTKKEEVNFSYEKTNVRRKEMNRGKRLKG